MAGSDTTPYLTMESVEECLEQSQNEPVFVLKHSTVCPTSTYAKREMDAFLAANPVKAYLVVVQEQRPIASELAERLDVKHESPQTLLIKDKAVASVLNHYDIVQDNLKKAVS